MGISENKACNCKADKVKGDDFFSPLKGKMKVLKKIKRRMGLASRSGPNGGGTNNLPPLLFHNVHGENIRISRDGTIATRVESFCKGIAFSSRPVKVNEKICVKFLEISNNWSGVIRFGFTYNDPSALRYGLPKYACPELTNKPGYWAKALAERFCSQNTVLFYYVSSTGDVHFGIDGEEKGIFLSGVDTRGPLWALIDVYGNSTAVEFVDVRHQLNNSRRSITAESCDNSTADDFDRIIHTMEDELSLQLLVYQPRHLSFQPMSLHRTKGQNARFGRSRGHAYRASTEFCQGYVFTARPLQIGERVVVQILATEQMYRGSLGLGLTSCDPASLRPGDLPDDSNCLLDRPEYWVISRDFGRNLYQGDEISFAIAPNGEVRISRNGEGPMVVIHVDQTLRLWAFFDLYGSSQRARVLSCPTPPSPMRRIISPSATESMNSINTQSELRRNSAAIHSNSRLCCVAPADVQVQPASNGGAVLSVILNPAHANLISQVPTAVTASNHHHSSQNSVHSSSQASHHSRQQLQQGAVCSPASVVPAAIVAPVQVANLPPAPIVGTMTSTSSSTYMEPVSESSYRSALGWAEQNGATVGTGTECTICYENSIDAVLYMCGHMCMCYECALQQWRGKGGGHCPLCRAVIRDVIRTYKS